MDISKLDFRAEAQGELRRISDDVETLVQFLFAVEFVLTGGLGVTEADRSAVTSVIRTAHGMADAAKADLRKLAGAA